ncbi:NADH-quinone oxidoreductase subunit L, partial [Patescibacteria group bacterium]|nr:NADH-quinone oxidoreductase subunit L [Patescibacteria group bacterium]
FMAGKPRKREYYSYLLLTCAAAVGAVLAANLVVFLLFWGILGVLLYAFLSLGSSRLATKGFFIIGAADFALILGALFLYKLSGTLVMGEIQSLPVTSGLAVASFVLLMIGAIAKAGAIPFHSWIPDAADEVPAPVMAYLPASLDKLLGIYFLTRICLDFFKLFPNTSLSILLMFIGSLTIMVAVMMALIQHDLKKLLSYHAISQVGYMVLGIGTGIPLGIAGGIFHMVNHAIYKSCLFLGGGSVEHNVKTTDINRLGGLAKFMPVTFITVLIAALSISGVPPFNGFFSKWMIYQGVVEGGKLSGSSLWIIWLLAAMFGSALTLASFVKLIHGTFLSSESDEVKKKLSKEKIKESPLSMLFPMVVLAGLCVVFGVFAYQVPLKLFIFPSVPHLSPPGLWIGWWQPGLTTILIILGIIVGFIIYLIGKVRKGRVSEVYIGGETVSSEMRVSGVDFYDTLRDFIGLRRLYEAAEKGALDIYRGMLSFAKGIGYFLWAMDRLADLFWRGLSRVVLLVGKGCSLAHTGVLHTYLAWYLLGLAILLLVFLRGFGG